MFAIDLEAPQQDDEFLIAELWDLGSCGISELDGGVLRAFFDDDSRAEELAARFQEHGARVHALEDRDWVAVSRELWEPIAVGEHFYLVPNWIDEPAPAGRLRISINPGLACGTGSHEATQLCLEALERLLRPGMTVLDVGTGSGILSQAAALLGAGRVWSCDVDPVAIEIARAACPLCFVGGTGAVCPGVADLVVANINAPVNAALAAEFLRCLKPRGLALLAGWEDHETQVVREAVEVGGGEVVDERAKGAWILLVVTRRPDPRARS